MEKSNNKDKKAGVILRRRIQQLARGKFEYSKPSLTLQTDKIEIEVVEERDVEGDFVITSANHEPMRGVVYSSNPRMECLTPQFEGEEVRIRYQFHSNGLVEGDIQKGEFCIVINQGEYNLSFVVSVTRLYAETSIGKISSLNDFVRLAEERPQEAYRLFYSGHFKNILKKDETKEALLYQGFSSGVQSRQKIEEFLVSCHKKPRVTLTLPVEEAAFYGVTSDRREMVELHKDHAGYVDIRVTSDADFLHPEKTHLSEEDFIGSVCQVAYYIEEAALHAGKNYARLRFETPTQALEFRICAMRQQEEAEADTARLDEKKSRVELLKLYLDYRLKRIVTGVWARESGKLLDHLSVLRPDEAMYPLMKAQTLIMNRQKQEADWILEDFKREWLDKNAPEWGYYLYLNTLREREPAYVDRLTEEIEQIFRKHPDSSLLFWILLFLREEYCADSAKRLSAIREWMKQNKSPYFYLEAYYLFWQEPYLLAELGEFELSVLHWAAKQKVMTKELGVQVISMLSAKKEFSKLLYHILEQCYEVSPEEEILSAICGYLIKSQCFTPSYHKWYEQAIAANLRITGLYEAYLMSLDEREITDIPKVVQLYFLYDNSLPYQKKAVLYVNIIAAKEKRPEVYQKYRRNMEQFAMEQIEAEHINDNLAIIYTEVLGDGIFNEEISGHFAKLLFTHKISTFKNGIVKAYVCQKALQQPLMAPVTGNVAYLQICTGTYCLLFEDSYGNLLCESVPVTDEALLEPERYIRSCIHTAPGELPYMLYQMQDKTSYDAFTEEDTRCFLPLLASKQVSASYKAALQPKMIQYYLKRDYSTLTGKYLLELDYGIATAEGRRFLIEALVEEHLYEKAYALVQQYGYDYLGNAAKVALCSYAVETAGYEEDDFLLGFATMAFLNGKYNDVMLIYLCKYYNGPTKQMAELWKAAGVFEIDTFDLEERILTQMLYTTDYVPDIQEIYDSYSMGGGRKMVCIAYLSYFAHAYFTKDAVVPEQVFAQIRKYYREGESLNDACLLGLLKYLAEKEQRSREETDLADELLEHYTAKNCYFSFYRKFEKKLIIKYHLYDKFFVEYHARPRSRVVIHYSFDGTTYLDEEMKEPYDGIYSKEFILFFGDTVQYYMAEESEGETKVTESDCLSNQSITENAKESRYERLNEMLFQETLEEHDNLKRELKNYYGMKRVTEEAFGLL